MAISVKIELDNRSVKNDGKQALKLLIVINRKALRISLGYSLNPKDWNPKLQSVKTSCNDFDNTTRFNNWLQKEKSRILNKLLELQEQGNLDILSLLDIKNSLTQTSNELKTIEFFKSVILEMELSQRFGNARVYDMVCRSISDFVNHKDFPFKQITYTWLKKYEVWYLSKGNSLNGLSVHMRTLRSVFNMAIKQKKITMVFYPFHDYTIKHEETRKRAINRDDLLKFHQFQPQTLRQTRAKDYFLISFYLMGASFVDIALLRVANIINNRIEYKRQKTGKLHSIMISKPLMDILSEYLDGKSENEFILEVVKSKDPKTQLTNIRDELRRYNRSLKEIAEICEIESSLSSYVARHSYATGAKKLGVPTSVISESLGHSSEKTTQIYLDSFENDVVDKYHEIIIDLPQK